MMIEGRANELPDFQVFKTVFAYCIVLICLPVASFFGSKLLFDGLLQLDPVISNVYSAVVAVVVLHIALGMYIFRAYAETDKPKAVSKQD